MPGTADLDELIDAGELAGPTAWMFGNEARGLPSELIALADDTVRVPIYGAGGEPEPGRRGRRSACTARPARSAAPRQPLTGQRCQRRRRRPP